MDKTTLLKPDLYRHWLDEHVRFSDLDPLGHVNNNAVGQYFENARASLYQSITPEWPYGHQILVLAHTAIDFHHELHQPAQLKIGTAVLKIGRTSFTVANILMHEKKVIATCESVSVLIDSQTRKPIVIPDTLRQRAAPFLWTPP